MPLVFNNTIIKELNGPYSMTCLQPIDPTQLQYYIILFGDVHNEENMRDCHDTKCYELQYEFIEKLNIFAEQVKVEFYVEEFFNRHNDIFDLDKKQQIKNRQNQIKELMDDTNLKIKGTMDQKHTVRNKYMNNKQYKIQKSTSHMTEFINLYKGCFYPHFYKRELCPYKNIFWQFTDTRKSEMARRDFNIFKFSNTLMELDDLYDILESKSSEKKIEDISNYLLTLFTTSTIETFKIMLRYFKLSLVDLHGFVGVINDIRLIHKQRQKLIPYMNSILSVESFVNHIFRYYLETCPITTHIDKLIQILDILIENIPEDVSTFGEYDVLPESKLSIVREMTENLNRIKLTKPEVNYYKHLPIILSAGFLDIYFILRIFKRPEYEFKLILGYFGDAHKETIINYLKNVLNYDISFNRKMRTVRRIYIEPTINLNDFFHLPIPEEYNSGLRDYVVIKSRRTSSSSRKRRYNKSLQGKQVIIHPDFVNVSPR